jgi:predicted negative regulator of RcsB-dependent stress response
MERFALGGDIEKTYRTFNDMKERFASTIYAQQAGLLVAKVAFSAGNVDAAKSALTWVVEKSGDTGYATIARLRLTGLMLDAKAYDAALTLLDRPTPDEFSALVADRRGDIYMDQGKKSEAKTEYQKAYRQFEERSDYRHLVEVKLNALGVSTGPFIKEEGSK